MDTHSNAIGEYNAKRGPIGDHCPEPSLPLYPPQGGYCNLPIALSGVRASAPFEGAVGNGNGETEVQVNLPLWPKKQALIPTQHDAKYFKAVIYLIQQGPEWMPQEYLLSSRKIDIKSLLVVMSIKGVLTYFAGCNFTPLNKRLVKMHLKAILKN